MLWSFLQVVIKIEVVVLPVRNHNLAQDLRAASSPINTEAIQAEEGARLQLLDLLELIIYFGVVEDAFRAQNVAEGNFFRCVDFDRAKDRVLYIGVEDELLVIMAGGRFLRQWQWGTH